MLQLVRRMSRILALTLAVLVLAPASPAAAAGPLAEEQAQQVRDFIGSALDELGIPGAAVVVVDRDGIVFAEGFGTARDDGTPVTPQTPFHVASLSKQLTSIAVMQLIGSGDLSLDATIHSYIDWFGGAGSDTAKITVRDLLAHTSGWSTEQGLTNRLDESNTDRTIEDNVRRLAAEPLKHPIGQFEYSNANFDTLGYLVAVVSAGSYEEYMTGHVLAPLQMTHTHLSEAEARADGLAQGHYRFFGVPISYDIPFVRGSLPSSFIAASAEDLGHVLIAHLNDGIYEGEEVLDASSMAALRQPLTNPDPWNGYGWGWWSYPFWDAGELKVGAEGPSYDVPVILEHTGGHATYASAMLLLADEGIGVVVLMNLQDDFASSRFYQLHKGVAMILLGRDAPALVSYDDPLGQYGRVIGIAWVLVVAALVAWSVRRYRRWRRDPGSTPRGRWAVVRRMVLPLLVDAALLAGFWLLLSTRSEISGPAVARLLRLSPDIGLVVVLVSTIALGWAVIGTIWTFRLLRRGVTGTESVRTSPGAP
jgi:CubicO group peptidase (beta-lactamase class C family)